MRRSHSTIRPAVFPRTDESGGFGKLIEPKDSKGWASVMNELIENKEVAQILGENGRKIAERDFTIERFNRDIVSYIQGTLNAT